MLKRLIVDYGPETVDLESIIRQKTKNEENCNMCGVESSFRSHVCACTVSDKKDATRVFERFFTDNFLTVTGTEPYSMCNR
jgi:hypothetical protein